MCPLIDYKSTINNSVIRWELYSPEDNIVAKFAFEEWSKIASDVDTEQELEELFINYPHLIQGFVLYENSSNLPIAFVYILKENKNGRGVSFHGGGWNHSIRYSFLYLMGTILLVEYILKQGYKVRTYCSIDNHKAYKFMHSLGFVRYRTTDERIYQWVNMDRLHQSVIYKRLILKMY